MTASNFHIPAFCAAFLFFASPLYPADPFQANIQPSDVARLESGRHQLRAYDYKNAEQVFESLVKSNPDYYRANYNLGVALAAQGKHAEAIQAFEKALSIQSKMRIKEYSVLNALGWSHLSIGNYQKAEEYLNEALSHEAENSSSLNVQILNNLGLLYYNTRDITRARECLEKASNNYQSNSAKEMLVLVNQLERFISDDLGVSYFAKISEADLRNSKNEILAGKSYDKKENLYREILIQDRANFNGDIHKDPEDSAFLGKANVTRKILGEMPVQLEPPLTEDIFLSGTAVIRVELKPKGEAVKVHPALSEKVPDAAPMP